MRKVMYFISGLSSGLRFWSEAEVRALQLKQTKQAYEEKRTREHAQVITLPRRSDKTEESDKHLVTMLKSNMHF